MRTCATCHRPIDRGSTNGTRWRVLRCLVCLVAETMRTFVYPPRKPQDKRS